MAAQSKLAIGFDRPARMLAFKLSIAMDSVASATVTYLLGEDESCEPSSPR
jgi:hypothetical protein